MSTLTVPDIESQIRQVTDEEVTAFQDNGWVALPGLVSGDLAGELLGRLKDLSDLHYDELPSDHPDAEAVIERVKSEGVAKLFFMSRLKDDRVYDIVSARALGEASARLTGTRPMRLFTDGVICKLPSWTEGNDVGAGGLMTGGTPWHQDFSPVPWDRAGGIQFWMALCDITPEMGSMQHLTGSHREPPLGCLHYTKDQTLKETYPYLWEKYELSPAHTFKAGDVLAHNTLTVHYAQPNQTDKLRWVYTSYRVPADTLYNGVPNPRFTEFGFEPWKPFEHPKFPIVAE